MGIRDSITAPAWGDFVRFVAVVSLACASSRHGQLPATPTDLDTYSSGYFRIRLSWSDNSDNEAGFRIRRSQGETGSWETVQTVGADIFQYYDQSPPLSPETEYCYRVAAFNVYGESASSNPACARTLSIPIVSCYADPEGKQQRILIELLTEPNPIAADWLRAVGLSDADPAHLRLITDDSTCQRIWDGIGLGRPPDSGYMAAFFELGGGYVVADYPPGGHGATFVVGRNYNLINPILSD